MLILWHNSLNVSLDFATTLLFSCIIGYTIYPNRPHKLQAARMAVAQLTVQSGCSRKTQAMCLLSQKYITRKSSFSLSPTGAGAAVSIFFNFYSLSSMLNASEIINLTFSQRNTSPRIRQQTIGDLRRT